MNKILVVILLSSVLLTSCWDERILEDLALITVITADLSDEGNIILGASYPEFSKGSNEAEAIIANKAWTTAEGIYKLSRLTDKLVIGGQAQVLLIGQELARQGISNILDTLQRNVEISSNLYICITEGKANDFLTKAFDDKPIDGFYISQLVRKQERINELPATSLSKFTNDFFSIRTDPILPYLILKDKEFEAARTGIFVDDKFVDSISTEETQLLIMLRNDGTSSQFTLNVNPDKNEYATISFVDSFTTVNVFREGEKLKFDVNLKMTADLIEYEARKIIHNEQTFNEIGKKFENHLQKVANEVIARLQREYGSDPIGLGEYARPFYNSDMELNKWREDFKASEINISVDLKIERDGDFE